MWVRVSIVRSVEMDAFRQEPALRRTRSRVRDIERDGRERTGEGRSARTM